MLVAVSNKDFVGETLGLDLTQRAEGTLAVLAVCAWEGARMFRVHDVRSARQALAAVSALRAEAQDSAVHDGAGVPDDGTGAQPGRGAG